MSHPTAFRELATLIEAIDAGNLSVTNVHAPNESLITDQTLTVKLSTTLQVDTPSEEDCQLTVSIPDKTTETATLADGVTIPLEVMINTSDAPTPAEQSTDEVEARVTDGGVAVAATTETATASTGATTASQPSPTGKTADGKRADGKKADGDKDQADDVGESSPPHRNPDRLREVYDPSKTFAEMTDALNVDVTPQTVRHHMIEQGIHEPNRQAKPDTVTATASTTMSPDDEQTTSVDESDSNAATETHEDTPAEPTDDTATDDQSADETDRNTTDTEAPPVTEDDLPAAVTLPSHLTVAELTQAVAEAQTLYEVQRDLRLDRSTARQLLRDLDILEFVGGRITTAENQQLTQTDVRGRIRQDHS